MFEADGEGADDRLLTALQGLHTFPPKRRMVYEEMLLSRHGKERIMTAIRKSRSPEVQAILDKWPGYVPNEMELKSYLYVTGEERGREEGRAGGHAEAILELLDQREIPTTPAVRERILACRDLDQLRQWLRRAVDTATAEAIFE